MAHKNFSIKQLIDIVEAGGSFRTGLNIYNAKKEQVLTGDQRLESADALKSMQAGGITTLPINRTTGGGVWDENGNEILAPEPQQSEQVSEQAPGEPISEVERAVKDIIEIKM